MALKETQTNMNIIIDKDILERAKAVAKYNETDVSKLVRTFLKKYLADNANLALKI